MADTAIEPITVSPMMDGQYFHTDGDPVHFLPPTDILSLDNMRQPSDPGDAELGLMQQPVAEVQVDEDDSTELSPEGILDEETVARGLSNLGRSADGMHQVYLSAAMPGFSLVDISILEEFIHLQKVEIPYNNVTDLSPLGKLPHLLTLDASHNCVSLMLDFTPPLNLKEVDLSYNQLTAMADLSPHHALTKLVLDKTDNTINDICGLENCRRLRHLSLAHNQIKTIEGLNNLPLRYLNLCHNKITKIENLESLTNLQTLNLAGNRVRSLQGLANHDLLETIDLEDNEVIDVAEVAHIQKLRMLRELNLLRNHIQELPDYRLAILFRIPSLTELDRHRVEVEEKVSAKNMFDASLEVIAARDHIMHVVYNFLQPSRVWDSTLPNVETPYPMLVLVGPQGSGKKDLAMKLVDEFADYFGFGISHTTRPPRADEEHTKDYYFVTTEKFEMDIKMGQFIQTSKNNDHWYGLQMEAIEGVARDGLACVVHMELEGVLTLKNTYFEPRYVLVMPLNKEAHEHRLRDRGLYSEEQMEKTLKRADIYAKYNQDHPGFFDMMISSEDIADAYRKLRRLVMDYLGISPSTPDASSQAFPATEMGDGTETYNQALTGGGASTNAMGARTWSKPSIPDSMSQVRGQMGSAAARGIVEEASLKRRHSAAKEVVAGYVPPIYEQILTQFPRTAPQTVEEQQGLGLEDSNDNRGVSAPNNNMNALASREIPGSPDTTTSNDSASSNLSDLDSARELQRSSSPKTHPGAPVTHSQPAPNDNLPTEKVNPLTLIAEKGYSASKDRLPEARPPSASREMLGSGHGNRPGSERHKILPPIGVAQ
ncbi:hypothetical protein ACOMHN_024221 [Nucella lapillus]